MAVSAQVGAPRTVFSMLFFKVTPVKNSSDNLTGEKLRRRGKLLAGKQQSP